MYCICSLSRSVLCNFVSDGNILKGGGRAPPPSPARADFSIMMGWTPEIANRHSVCTLWMLPQESKIREGLHYAMGRKIRLQISFQRSITQTSVSLLNITGFHDSNRRSLLSEFELLFIWRCTVYVLVGDVCTIRYARLGNVSFDSVRALQRCVKAFNF